MSGQPTPGPWRIGKHSGGQYKILPPGDSMPPVAAVFEQAMALSHGRGEKPYPVQANAHLIAAAPELLEAAKRMVEVGFDADFYTEEENEVIDMLQAAIAKAVKYE